VLKMFHLEKSDASTTTGAITSKGFISFMSLLISSLYTLLISGAISPFICVSAGGRFVLASSPSITCFEGEWARYLPSIIFFIILYVLIYPACVSYVFFKNKNDLSSALMTKDFGHLTDSYKEKYFYWELMVMFKRASFVFFSMIIPIYGNDGPIPYFVTFAWIFLFLYIEVITSPYKKQLVQNKSFSWTLVTVILLLCDGLVFKNSNLTTVEKDRYANFMIFLLVLLGVGITVIFIKDVKEKREKKAGNIDMQKDTETQQTNANLEKVESAAEIKNSADPIGSDGLSSATVNPSQDITN
jgi:hypothetical protein